ncbi:MAG: NAD(P)-dependent oxidoreductase [Anaerolineae bacterium]|nr:NAD(P)-dependent oxidoreductase [Anaerolineae bacterium]
MTVEKSISRVGFVGLGSLGGNMVKRLLDKGYTVVGHNRTKAKAEWLIEAGMVWADSPRAVAEATDYIFTVVADTQALQAVVLGPDGILEGLQAGKIFVDMSTVSPSVSRELAAKVAETGATMLDAPVSGSIITLAAGKLSIMVGGDKAAFETVLPVLKDLGPTVTHLGDNGVAVAMKIGLNIALPVQFLAFCEGVLIAEKSGVPRKKAVEVYLNSALASGALMYRGPYIVEEQEEILFNVDMMQKDIQLALEAGRDLDVSLPTTAISNELLTAARAMGLADQEFSVLFNVLAALSGVEP